MCKTIFGDEGELIIEELFKLGQCSMSTVLFRAAKRMKMAKKDEVDFSAKELITSLRKKFVEVVECQFLCRVPSPYVDNPEEPDPQIKSFPKLTMTPALMFIVPEINFKVGGYFNFR